MEPLIVTILLQGSVFRLIFTFFQIHCRWIRLGEHGSILEVFQQPVHHPRPHVQPHHVLPQVGRL